MEILKYIALCVVFIGIIAILIIAIKSRKPFKFLILNALIGFALMLILHFTEKFTGIKFPINQYTAIGGSILGVPAIIGFLIFNIIFV